MPKLLREYGDPSRPSSFYMGIDQSYTGFAITMLSTVDPTHYRTTVWSLINKDAERLWDAQQLIAEQRNGAREVVMEGYAPGAKFGREMAGELGGAVKLALRPVMPKIVAPSGLKKWATGKGNASKTDVVMGVYKKFGVEFDDDNAADSYVAARIASGHADTEYQREVLAKVGIIPRQGTVTPTSTDDYPHAWRGTPASD